MIKVAQKTQARQIFRNTEILDSVALSGLSDYREKEDKTR